MGLFVCLVVCLIFCLPFVYSSLLVHIRKIVLVFDCMIVPTASNIHGQRGSLSVRNPYPGLQ